MAKRTAYEMPLWKGGPTLVYFIENEKPNPLGIEVSDEHLNVLDPYTANIITGGEIKTFAERLGFVVEKAPKGTRIPRYGDILKALKSKGFEVPERKPKAKGKGKPKKAPRKPRPKFSPETCPDYDLLRALQEEFPYTGKARIQPDGRGMIFSMKDNRGKDAHVVYDGNGTFRPATDRDIRDLESGTRTIARNKWATRVLTEKWAE
jgi:hypothetical protein